jgi:16S rRNA (cytosine967-C5)-methyltransferase
MAAPVRHGSVSGMTHTRQAAALVAGTGLTARLVALQALVQLDTRAGLADEILDRLLRASGLDARDRGLAWELVYGVLRYRLSVDWRLGQVSERAVERLPVTVRAALRLGAYQLLYLTRIPASAAVNESVRLIRLNRATRAKDRHASARDWSGYVNAVLRNLLRRPQPALPDIEAAPVAGLSLRYSSPDWLTGRWVARLGVYVAERLCRQSVEIPPQVLRTNVLRTTRSALEHALMDAGCRVTPTRLSPVGLLLEKGSSIGDATALRQFKEGWFYIEDEAAQLIALLLDPRPGERILDACAAPGGKATHLAALMENRGEVVAMDQSARRLQRLEENCRRLGTTIVRPIVGDIFRDSRETGGVAPARDLTDQFDRILVDAPCSGLGVLRRHPEAKWHRRQASLQQHHATQLKILKMAAKRLRPDGVLVYSTCSTEPEENEGVIEEFCRMQAGFHREPVGPYLPAHARDLVTTQGDLSTAVNSDSMDGFFAARLRLTR